MAEKAAPAVEKVVPESEELPKAIVRRLVKEKLNNLSSDGEISVFKEALQAFSESARIFIHYLSAAANDICRESKRQTINAEDVLKALEELEFPEFVVPLRASLEEFRQKNAGKRSASTKAKGANKKQKTESPVENGGDEKEDDGEEENEANGKRTASTKEKGANKNQKTELSVENGDDEKDDDGEEENEDGGEEKDDDGDEQNEANDAVPDTESPEGSGN